MSVLPNAGVVEPLPDTFPFDAWTTMPSPKDPAGRSLRLRNSHNHAAEKFNEVSMDQTLNCKEDRAAHPDVGPPLKAFYGYTQDDMSDMIHSEVYCTDVGPLPTFMRQQIERSRRKRVERAEAEKADKTKGRPLQGAMILSNPITRVPGQATAVKVPDVVLQSMVNKLYVPLHWFTDERLQAIQHSLHDLPTKLIRPEVTAEVPSPEKVLVFDMQKMLLLANWGSDEFSTCLSPLKWQQSSLNMEAALTILSETVTNNPNKETFATQFSLHRRFFTNYPKFEENYGDWYNFEREARHEILQGYLFDADYYARQVDGRLHAKHALALQNLDSPSRKRTWDREVDASSRPPKVPRQGNDSPSSFRGDYASPRGDSSSFRSGSGAPRGPTCIACDGPHRLKHHPVTTTTFVDSVTTCFSLPRQGDLWTVKPFRGAEPKRICVEFNLPQGCHRTHEV
ncbi:hypothetical protein C8R47DRAFT_1218305 [Mycena vitilis]|nr:hypothetical protein C8R47DRAFT_1218305 [Mycena vitilis]